MILRVLNFVVIGALVLAAAWVYRIKFDATGQGERLAKLRGEVRHERDDIAALRAEWGQLDNPERIEALANRYLQLKPIAPTQFDTLDHLSERLTQSINADKDNSIGGVIKNLQANFQRVEGAMGATILGDGRVTLIIDIAGLVELSRRRQRMGSGAAGSADRFAGAVTGTSVAIDSTIAVN